MEPRRIKTRTTARALLSFSETLNLACSVSHCLTPAARTNTERSTGLTAVGTRASGADDWTQSGRQMARIFPLLKLVQGMSWDGEGLGRRGRPPKVTLDASSVDEAGETLRSGGSSITVSWQVGTLDPARTKHRKGRRK